jgi:O-acetyl-ADP-ribose deacetylase (regulator of RNase III)
VGPIWRGGDRGEPELLESAYEASFTIANRHGSIRTIAFSAISTGVYGFPKPKAAQIALRAMIAHEPEFESITACLFDDENVQIYTETLERMGPE